MILKYQSGEEIKKGDHVLFHRNPATIEFVVVDASNPETAWDFREYGGGVMIREPHDPNPTLIQADHLSEYEDLEFVSRAE